MARINIDLNIKELRLFAPYFELRKDKQNMSIDELMEMLLQKAYDDWRTDPLKFREELGTYL